MTDRSKTAWILGGVSLTMFSPLAMVLVGYRIPMFQNLGFERDSMASPIAWILATIVGIVYVLYTIKAIPFIASMQREISLFKLLGILAAVVGGIVEEVFFRRWIMDMLMSRGFASITPGRNIRSRIWFGTCQLDTTRKARLQGYASGNHLNVNSRDLSGYRLSRGRT